MNTQNIAEIYQIIGRILRAEGADRVFLLNSKIISQDPWKLSLELVVDQIRDITRAKRALYEKYPDFAIELIDGSDPDNYDILEEGGSEGIHL